MTRKKREWYNSLSTQEKIQYNRDQATKNWTLAIIFFSIAVAFQVASLIITLFCHIKL